MKYGNYTTMDCPTGGDEVIVKAKQWLSDELDKIGGEVRLCRNSHDMGEYPSFEIDHDRYEELSDAHDSGDCEAGCEGCKELDSIVEKLNDVEKRYNNKFEDNL